MAVTSQQIVDFLLANPGMSDAQIVAAMEQYGVSPAQMATAVGLPEGEVAARAAATVPNGQTITLGDTIVQPVYQVTGSGDSEQVGGIENVITYKATDNKAGGAYTQYTPTGEVEKTGTQQEVKSGLKEFAIGAGILFGLPSILNAGAAATLGTTAITAAEAAGLGLTATEAAGLGLSATEFAAAGGAAAGGAGGLLTSATPVAAGSTATGAAAGGAAGGGGLLTTPAVTGMGAGTGLTAGAGGLGLSTGGAGLGAAGTGAGLTAGAGLAGANALTGAGLGTALGGITTGVGAAGAAAGTGLPTTVATKAAESVIGKAVGAGLTTAGGLVQSQVSKEAAQAAQKKIDEETAAAKSAAAFRPIGMTTRFGASQFQVDPATGQLTSAGYTLSPEAKAAQDRFVKLAESGLQQAEGAQQAFAPLQTGAQRLFGLGNQYLAQTPEAVAQNYLNQQMALLQPGRELELANLQNKLQQQGRGGLSVAQGGTMGATTPELQALYNARAAQEAQLAANAQQAGQRDVLFGAGLLGQGSQAMGQYYGGQQAAYSPYTTAFGQIQGLETAAQQPFQMGVNLGQIASQAGANVGKLGLTGAGQSVALATGAAATNSPLATTLTGLGSSGLLTTGIDAAVNEIGNQLNPSREIDPRNILVKQDPANLAPGSNYVAPKPRTYSGTSIYNF